MNNNKNLLKVFIISCVLIGIGSYLASYFNNMVIGIVLVLVLGGIQAIILAGFTKSKNVENILNYISNIDNIEFSIPADANISEEEKEKISNVYKKIMRNLKTQVEISTDIFNVSEQLNALSVDSLNASENISCSVDIADKSISEQSIMINNTNNLALKVFDSMDHIASDVIEKISYISNSIESAQQGIEGMADIELRVKASKDMLQNISNKMLDLKNYSDEVVKLVDLINNISGQTQLLSLNASIEAARAGEHGRGFGVVAMEVGKLAMETEDVSKKIEEVVNTLISEINFISDNMGEEMTNMDSNYRVITSTNKDFAHTLESLNIGKESLEGIKDSTSENNLMLTDISNNISKIAEFTEEISAQISDTTSRTMEQYDLARSLNKMMEEIRNHIHSMQQFVVGKAMEEKMLVQTYKVKDFFVNNRNVTDEMINKLLKELEIDAVYITNPQGVVEYTNEKSAMGLNLYEADPSFQAFKETKVEYLVTPIKQRVEDGKLFKFLTVTDEAGRLYEVGLGLESLIRNI